MLPGDTNHTSNNNCNSIDKHTDEDDQQINGMYDAQYDNDGIMLGLMNHDDHDEIMGDSSNIHYPQLEVHGHHLHHQHYLFGP